MAEIRIYEPALCCPTGVCGVEVSPTLVNLTADHDALTRRGARIERFNLSSQPTAFVSAPAVRGALQREGTACLPLVLVDGEIVSRGRYPSRDELERWAGLVAEGAIS